MTLRVLHLITRLPVGGAERLIVGILRNLDPQRIESRVCCIQDRGELADEVEALGIPVISLGLMRKHGHDRAVAPALVALMREHKIDVLHSHLYHANLYGRLAARRLGIPAIASVHNTYSKPRWLRHLLNRYLAGRTYRITAGSTEVRRDILRHDRVPADKVVLLPNAIDLARTESSLTPAEARLRLGCAADDRVIGTVGRLEEQKGQRHLLDAFALLRAAPEFSGAGLKLLIVGDGRLRDALRAQAEALGIADACRFPGTIGELGDVYRAIDIFVMPSLWEGLSLAMLEAMAAGLPMVATEVGGAREVLGDDRYGKVVPPGDAAALAAAIRALLNDPTGRGELAAAGAARVREHYSVAALARQLTSLYEGAEASRAPQNRQRSTP